MDPQEQKRHPSEFVEFVTLGPQSFRSAGNLSEPKASSARDIPNNGDDVFTVPTSLAAGQPSLDAKAGVEAEQQMSFMDGVRLYSKAIAWSMLLSATTVMEGYDTILIGNFFAFPIFRKSYGHFDGEHGYQISPSWQTGLPNGACAREIIGLFLNRYLTEQLGCQKTVMVSPLRNGS